MSKEDKLGVIDERILKYLKVVVLAQLLLEANESLQGTKLYNKAIKHKVGQSNRVLSQLCEEQYNTIYSKDPTLATNILNKIEVIVAKMTTFRIDDLVMLEGFIDRYKDDPEWVKNNIQQTFTKLK